MKGFLPLMICSTLLHLCIVGTSFSQANYGTSVAARVIDELDSESSADISNAKLIVASDIYVDGKLYIKREAEILNNVTITKRSGVGKPGIIEINAISTTDVDGKTVPLNGTYTTEGKSNRGKALGVGLGVGLGTFLVPMLAYMAKKGEPVDIKPNTVINEFFIAQ